MVVFISFTNQPILELPSRSYRPNTGETVNVLSQTTGKLVGSDDAVDWLTTEWPQMLGLLHTSTGWLRIHVLIHSDNVPSVGTSKLPTG